MKLRAIVLVAIICCVQAIDFDPTTTIANYGIVLDTVIDNPSIVADTTTASKLSQCASKSQIAMDALNNTAQILIALYPQLNNFFDQAWMEQTSIKVSLCEVKSKAVPDSSYSFAITSSADDSSDLCPEGSILDFTAPVVKFVDTPTVYIVVPRPPAYSNGFILAYTSDPDGDVVIATPDSALPPGVSLNATNGNLYVSDMTALVYATYTVAATVQDALGWTTSPSAVINIAPKPVCAPSTCSGGLSCCDDATMGATCYDSSMYSCPSGNQGPVLCGNVDGHSNSACGTTCYDNVNYVCCADNNIYLVNDANAPCHVATSAPTPAPATSTPSAAPTATRQTCAQRTCGVSEGCCDDANMGATCYDTSSYGCPVGSKGNLLCGKPLQACGTTCYDASNYKCCSDALFGNNDANIPC